MSSLAEKETYPCGPEVPPLSREKIEEYLEEVEGWSVAEDDKSIFKEFTLVDFTDALKFVNKVAAVVEEAGHHPDIYIWYNKVKLTFYTHTIKGLSENDFIVAARIDGMS